MRRHFAVFAAVSLLALDATSVSLAQNTLTVPTNSTQPQVDESALRYFARQGDQKRLEAEIARLTALYPGWQPPANPLADTGSGVDTELQGLWDIYGTGDIPKLHQAIADRQSREPGWTPPDDLAKALQLADARLDIAKASDAKNDDQVLALAATNTELMVCDNMDTLWRVGQAFADTGKTQRSVDLYSYILQNCDNAGERIATMQKALAMLGVDGVQPLFAFEKQANGTGEFAPIRLDIARQSIADAMKGVTTRASDDALKAIRDAVAATPNAGDLQLLGYYELDHGSVRTARDLFRKAFELQPDATTATGLATALLRYNDPLEAEGILADYRSDTPEIEKLYLSVISAVLNIKPVPNLATDVLTRISETITDARSAQGAHDLGWYAYQFRQYRVAAQWFETALGYDPTMEDAAYGLVVASNQLKDTARIRELQQQWGSASPRIRLFGRPGAPTEAPVSYRFWGQPQPLFQPAMLWYEKGTDPTTSMFMLVQGQSQSQIQAAGQCASFVPPESLSTNAALGRAWCLMSLNRNAEAEAAFRRATTSPAEKTRTEAYYGLTLALLRLGLPNDAAVAAAAMPQTRERSIELQTSILADTAVSLYKIGKFEEALQTLNLRAQMAPERNDLLVVRAWSYYHLGYLGEAKRIFTAVAATGYQDAQRGLDAIAAKGTLF